MAINSAFLRSTCALKTPKQHFLSREATWNQSKAFKNVYHLVSLTYSFCVIEFFFFKFLSTKSNTRKRWDSFPLHISQILLTKAWMLIESWICLGLRLERIWKVFYSNNTSDFVLFIIQSIKDSVTRVEKKQNSIPFLQIIKFVRCIPRSLETMSTAARRIRI